MQEKEQIEEPTQEEVQKAENGNPKYQLKVAKFYLNKGDVEVGPEAEVDSKKGVELLIQASQQGEETATQELLKCLDCNHIGIGENVEKVLWCVQTPALEKRARNAARGLYKALNPLEGGRLTKDTYMKAVESLVSDKAERKLLQRTAKFKKESEIDEEAFVNKVVGWLSKGGVSSSAANDGVDTSEAYKNASWITKVRRYPQQVGRDFADQIVEFAGKQGLSTLRALIPTHQIYLVFAFFTYSLLSLEMVMWGIPLLVFYAALAAMIISTMQMFYSKRKATDVRAMASMLNKFSTEVIDDDSVESAYDWSQITPYWTYFSAMLVMTSVFSICDKNWIPCSELALVSLFFTATCFFALSDKYDYLSLLSIVLDLVSTLPHFVNGIPHVPVVKPFINLFLGCAYTVEITSSLHVNLGFPSLAYMAVPVLFIKMAIKKSWSGTYRVLIPHLVCFFWWKIGVLFYLHSTWVGLIRGSLGWVLLVVLLPVFALVCAIYTVIYFMKIFTLANLSKLITTLVFMVLPIAFGFWAKAGFQVRGFQLDNNKSPISKAILVLVFLVSAVPLIHYYTPPERSLQGNYLSWSQYQRYCSKPRWEKTNMAESMQICSKFQYSLVEWEGHINKIVVDDVYNPASQAIKYLPYYMSEWIRCTYGEKYPNCTELEDPEQKEICELATMQHKGKCHLQNLNKYTFVVWVKMPITFDRDQQEKNGISEYHDIKLIATDWFKETLMELKTGDVIYFRASLQENLGNIWPELRLYYVECKSCEGKVVKFGSKTFLSETSWNIFNLFKISAFETWNFFFSPVIQLQL